jgi:hypothetical protein
MRNIVLVGAFLFSASTCLAQTAAPLQPAAPAISAQPDKAAAVKRAGPANLCQEVLAFMKAPTPEPAAPATAKPAAPAASTGAAQNGSSALAGTSASGEGASPKADAGTNSAKESTGQQGVATDAPDSSDNRTAASGSVENAPKKDSLSAPPPAADVTSTPKESVLTVAAAEQLAAENDIAGCQKSAREMRVAGVEMPPPLVALAALDLQYQQPSGASAPSGTDEPSAN